MTGETHLPSILATLDVDVRPGTFFVMTRRAPDPAADAVAEARISEREGVTYVVPEAFARAQGYRTDELVRIIEEIA